MIIHILTTKNNIKHNSKISFTYAISNIVDLICLKSSFPSQPSNGFFRPFYAMKYDLFYIMDYDLQECNLIIIFEGELIMKVMNINEIKTTEALFFLVQYIGDA